MSTHTFSQLKNKARIERKCCCYKYLYIEMWNRKYKCKCDQIWLRKSLDLIQNFKFVN